MALIFVSIVSFVFVGSLLLSITVQLRHRFLDAKVGDST